VLGKGALAGTAAAAFTTAGDLTEVLGDGGVSGTSAMTFAASGSLTGKGSLAGTTAPAFTTAGAVTGKGALTGQADILFDVAAVLGSVAQGAVAGTSVITLSATGALTGKGALAGTSAMLFGGTGIFPSTEVPSTERPAGGKSRKPSKRRRKPVLVEIDGQQFVVNSEAEAVELAEKAAEAAKEVAERQAAEIVSKREKKARKAAINTSPLRLDEPLIEVKPFNDGAIDQKWLAEVSARMDSIKEAYRAVAERYETSLLLKVKEELDEEDTLVAILLTL
jgi:hypothetical protein